MSFSILNFYFKQCTIIAIAVVFNYCTQWRRQEGWIGCWGTGIHDLSEVASQGRILQRVTPEILTLLEFPLFTFKILQHVPFQNFDPVLSLEFPSRAQVFFSRLSFLQFFS